MDSADLPSIAKLRVTPDEARGIPVAPGHLSTKLMQHGSMEVRWFQPRDHDLQVPHDRDELYVVVQGTAMFVRAEETTAFGDDPAVPVRGDERVTVQAGDALFVPAGTEHRFEAMSGDFGAWMIFYGPEGGERP